MSVNSLSLFTNVGSWPNSAVRLSIAGCKDGKVALCHGRPVSTHCRRRAAKTIGLGGFYIMV
jgi:hypothetical protein